MTLSPLGDSAVVVAFGPDLDEAVLRRVQVVVAALERERPAWVCDVVPAFASVTVFYDAVQAGGYARLGAEIEATVARALHAEEAGEGAPARVVEIPVCYGGEFGPDLGEVAACASAGVGEGGGLSVEDVVGLHTAAEYAVHAIGFAPGFAYLGGLPEILHTPRRATPRTRVAAGSVGIGGAQTGVYPLATPGGWNLIGRTPLRLFDAGRAEPAMLRAGDRVRFRAIGAEEFAEWR